MYDEELVEEGWIKKDDFERLAKQNHGVQTKKHTNIGQVQQLPVDETMAVSFFLYVFCVRSDVFTQFLDLLLMLGADTDDVDGVLSIFEKALVELVDLRVFPIDLLSCFPVFSHALIDDRGPNDADHHVDPEHAFPLVFENLFGKFWANSYHKIVFWSIEWLGYPW